MNTPIFESELWQKMIEADNQVKNAFKFFGEGSDVFLSYDNAFKQCILALEEVYGKDHVMETVKTHLEAIA